jgi:Phosphodiester glycosidase/IQ calmodulin-binding motif
MNQGNETKSAVLIQKIFRGYRQRKKLHVASVEPGIIRIKIRGDNKVFEHIGIQGIDPSREKRIIDILTIDFKMYQGRVVGDEYLFNPVTSSSSERQKSFGSAMCVYINASFFNSNTYFSAYPESATIGPVQTNEHIDNIPIAKDYKDDYCQVKFKHGDFVTTAPLLAKYGILAIDEKKYISEKYQYDTIRGKQCPPGSLFHFSDPNPRSAISFPAKGVRASVTNQTHQDRIRVVTARATTRGLKSDGCTMFEWARIMTRISNLNAKPGHALNLDGGASVTMGIAKANGDKSFEANQEELGRDNSTYIVYSCRQ